MTSLRRVGDVLKLQRRAVEVDPNAEYEEIGIRSFGKGIFHKDPVSGLELGNKRVFRIEPGDLVLSNVFAWEGAVAVAGLSESGKIGSHRFMTFTPIDNQIDTTWATWFFLSEPGLELIGRASPGSAGRNRTLAIERFENLVIPLPPISEQRATAASLDRTNEIAGRVGEALSAGAAEIHESLPDVIDALLRQRAIGWSKVSEVADFVSDTVHPGDDPAPADRFVGLQHVRSHTGQSIGFDSLGPMQGRKFRFRPGDVVYGYLRPYLNKVWVADRDGLCSVDQYVLRPHANLEPELLGAWLRSRSVLDLAIANTHSLQLPRLRSGLLGDFPVPVLADGTLKSTVAQLQWVNSTAEAIHDARARQRDLAAAILPAARNAAFTQPN